MMKRIVIASVFSTFALIGTTACNYESPQDQYKRECKEQGGTIRSTMEDDGEQVYTCVYPGESYNPAQND